MQTDTTMGDHANQDDLTAAMALMQQQMQQMQQTIQAQQDAAEQAALARQEQRAQTFFKNCRETQEEIKVLYTKALSTPALKVLPKVDDPGKFVFPCSIAGTTFKDTLCDSGSCVNLISKAILDDLGIADVEQKLKVVPEKEHGDKGEGRLGGEPEWSRNQNHKWHSERSCVTSFFVTSPYQSSKKKKNENNVMEKGKKEKKHGATGKVEQEVGTKSGVALDGRWTSWNKRGRKQCNLPPVALIYLLFLFFLRILRYSRQKKPDLRVGDLCLILCKGRRLHLSHHREESPEPLFYFIYTSKVDIRVFCEHIGLDLYCLLSHLDPNESLGIKIDQHREQYHDSGLFYLSDPSSRLVFN
ncbi:hypothetical protein IGI04_019588 [Brassica rapa subsp. trilocularis]|uniref:Uncharacterized protein n=1 Tax=Brassica rapa subsp. trilocularis TaxID=1813537 RepID=A0ABQ7MGA7_BRACM|nr:hypothetical protein IGI04_019588 [Brassica rapa subsp. trilocularis]